jgi:hypothetical protein
MQIIFGAMAPSLKEQIGDLLPRKYRGIQLRRWQHDADAVTRLVVRGLITDKMARSARRQIVRRLEGAAREGGYLGNFA